MKTGDLEGLRFLNQEIEDDIGRLEALKALATGAAVRLDGLPHAHLLSDKTAVAAELADARSLLEVKIQASVVTYNRLHRFIAEIEDPLMRQIVALRHVNGLGWRQVASHIGGGNTEDGVRQAYRRWRKKEEERELSQQSRPDVV